MSLLPDIIDGHLADEPKAPKLYTPPARINLHKEEARFAELQNLGYEKVAEDFSDSPALDK